LKARSKRGAIGESWWSGRFIGVMESLGMGGRLTRGKNYARRGQVLGIDVEPGAVAARVQGSRATPYRVRVGVRPFGKADWNRVVEALADNAWYLAKLLAGEMPEDVEELFTGLGLPLFPASADELTMDCSCPDWGVPCKHIAAVFYLLAEAFDEDPFLILAWRGRERTELLDTLSALRSGVVPADRLDSAEAAVPLAQCLDNFYAMGAAPVRRPVVPAPSDAILVQVPAVGLLVRATPLTQALRPAYLALGGKPRS
jgi:uncharacterized Zn finger protein